MQPLKVCRMGDSLGVTLPQEILDKLNVKEGDSLFIFETSNGLQISSHDPNFEEAMTIYRKGSHQYHNALKELA